VEFLLALVELVPSRLAMRKFVGLPDMYAEINQRNDYGKRCKKIADGTDGAPVHVRDSACKV